MEPYFEKVSRFKDIDLKMPIRKTEGSAGYDFIVAEDIIVPSYFTQIEKLKNAAPSNAKSVMTNSFDAFFSSFSKNDTKPLTLDEISDLTKKTGAKPTLVSTGMKAYIPTGCYLELSVRSSCPLKNWLVLANGVGIIDRDYWNNSDNEGEIFFQFINLSPFEILLRQGDAIGQGIIKPYLTVKNDNAKGERVGGFGSTGSK